VLLLLTSIRHSHSVYLSLQPQLQRSVLLIQRLVLLLLLSFRRSMMLLTLMPMLIPSQTSLDSPI
jgi:hypothetical protein